MKAKAIIPFYDFDGKNIPYYIFKKYLPIEKIEVLKMSEKYRPIHFYKNIKELAKDLSTFQY